MATRAGRIEQEIRRTVKEEQHNEVSLRKQLAGQGKDKDEVDRAIGKMLTSGELVADHYCKAPKGRLSFTEELRKINPPLVLRARLDMSGRIRHALLSYRKEKNEVTRDALQALCKQVYTIENFTAADYDNFFDYGLRRAVEEGLIEEVMEGEERMYRSGERKSKILMCVLCANTKSNVHERILKCTNCLWQRHASCMGLRKHKITGDFECEKCARCRDCGKEPTACNPLAWCPKCYEPKHVRRCELRETTGDEELDGPTVQKCAACGGQRLQSPTKETASLSPHATCSSASSQVTAMTTPGSEKGKLTDSLSAFFTPTPGGRRRKTTINTHEDSTSDEEPDGRASKPMGPLSVEVGTEGAGGSGTASKTTPSSTTSSSHHHRRAEEQLHDALSPYFSAASGKRRSAVKGEYARMQQGGGGAGGGSQGGHSSGGGEEAMLSPGINSPKRSRRGRPPRNPSVASTLGLVGSPTSASTRDEEKEDEDEDGEEEQEQRVKMAVASPRRKSQSTSPSKKRGGGDGEEWRMQGRSTQNSASAALFSSSPDDRRGGKGQRKVKKEIESDESDDDAPLRKIKSSRHPPPPQASTATTSKSPLHKRIKRELRSSGEDTTQSDGSDSDDKPLMQRRAAPGSSLRPAAAAAEPSTSRGSPEKKMSKKIKEEPRKSVAVPAANIKPPQSPIDSTRTGVGSSLGGIETWSDIKITQEQWAAYEACTEKANAAIEKTPLLTADGRDIPRWPETICFGKWEMETWFTAPYPNEYANTKKLYICEFCLKYMRTFTQLERHAEKCKSWHPPGNEIYRKDDVSVFEVDGNVAGIYCQNLCLLAKLYLDHKTLYYDVEPFLFYIVTKNDETGCHFVGYFSKEKYSAQKFNLSCIVTLPCYHKQGFGRFLIDFSYLLTRREKMVGSPERPLSDLGRVSYAAYWRSALLEYMRQKVKVEKNEGLQFSEIAADTGISLYDATTTMEALGMLVKSENGGMEFLYNEELVEGHWTKAHANKGRIWLDETALKWIPVAHTPSKDFAIIVRSPARMVSPTPSHAGVTPTGVPLAACGSTIKRGPLAAANAVPPAAAAAAAASGPTPRKQPGAVKMAEKKRATRQLKLEDVGFGGGATSSSKTSTATPARKSRRIAAASEDSSLASTSSDEEKKKKPESKGTCKPDTGKRRNRRSEDSDSSDEEREGGGGGGGASPKKRPSASGPSSASTRRASGASRGAAAPPASPPKGRKRGGKGGRGRESEDDEEGEVSSAYATTSSDSDDSSDSDSDQDTSFHPQTARRPPPPSKGKKGSKGKPTPQIPQKKGARAAPQKGKKNGVTGTTVTPSAGASTTTSPPSTVAVKGRKKELKSPGKVFPSNYSAMIAARKQQQAAAAAAESAAAPGCSSQAAAAAAGADLAAASTAAAAAGEEDGRPASPADSLCSTATIPMRQAPEGAADQSMLTDDGCAHESEGREHTPGPSASALSSRPSSCGRGRKVERRRNGRTRRGETSEDEQSDSSIGGSSSGSSLFRGASPRPMGDRVPSTSGGTMNMGWDEEETDHDRTMRMEQLENGPISAPPVSSSSSERPPSLQAMSPIEPRVPEEPDQPTLGSLLSHEMAKGGGGLLSAAAAAAGAASSSSLLQQLQLQQQQRKPSAAATAALTPMSNGVGKAGPSSAAVGAAAAAAAGAACSTDDSEDDAPPCLSPQYARVGEREGDFSGAANGGGGEGASSSNDDGGASSDASAAPILAPSNVTRTMSLDHAALAASAAAAAGPSSSSSNGHALMGRRISEQSCAAAAAAYDPFNTPPKAPLPSADQLLSVRPSMDTGVSHQELNFGMAPHSLHGRLSGGEGGPGPPPTAVAQTSPLLQQQQQLQLMQQHTTPQMMTYPGSASGGGMQSTPGSVPPSSAHNTPESMLQQSQTTPLMQQQQQQLHMQQFASPTNMQQQMYSQQPSSVHSTHSGHHDMSGGGGGGGPGSVPAGYGGQQMLQGGHSNPSTPLRAMAPTTGGPGSANQPPFNSPTPVVSQPLSVPEQHQHAAAAAAAAPALAGRRSSEAASVGPPNAAAGGTAATTGTVATSKKRSSTGGGTAPPMPSPLAAQQQQQVQQAQHLQQQMNQQMMQAMMVQQSMQSMHYMQYNQAYNNVYMQYPAMATAQQFAPIGYPPGMMQSGKAGPAAAVAAAAAAAATTPFYAPYPGMQPMQQQQQRAAAAAAAASWQTTPSLGPPFPGTAAAPGAANNFMLNGTMPSYPAFQQTQPFPY